LPLGDFGGLGANQQAAVGRTAQVINVTNIDTNYDPRLPDFRAPAPDLTRFGFAD
jgi:hypothetical protein